MSFPKVNGGIEGFANDTLFIQVMGDPIWSRALIAETQVIKPHRIRVSVIRREIYQSWNWYGSDLQTLEDQAHQVLKKFHDVDPR